MANEEMVRQARQIEARVEFLKTAVCPSRYEEEPAREALRALAGKLRAVYDSCDELGAEARLIWLASLLPLGEVTDIAKALGSVAAVCDFVDNWSDCARPQARSDAMAKADRRVREIKTAIEVVDRELGPIGAPRDVKAALVALLDGAKEREADEHEAFFTKVIDPAREAASAAMSALLALVDAMRARAPESLR